MVSIWRQVLEKRSSNKEPHTCTDVSLGPCTTPKMCKYRQAPEALCKSSWEAKLGGVQSQCNPGESLGWGPTKADQPAMRWK